MKYSKSSLRKRSLLLRKKNFSKVKKVNFKIIFNLIKKHLKKKKIVIAGYYPADYELDIKKFYQFVNLHLTI